MASRHDLSPLPPSSTFSQSTPALSQRPPYSHNASSSSPPNDLIATPSDRYDSSRGTVKQGKKVQRRSVRIRSSSGGNFDSSPQIGFSDSAPYRDEKPCIDELSAVVDFSHSQPSALNGRASGGRPITQRTSSLDHFAVTHPHPPYGNYPSGQLETTQQQQGAHYAHHEAPPTQFSNSNLPPFPSQVEPPQRRQQLARSSSSHSFPLAVNAHPYEVQTSNQATTPSTSSFPYSIQAPLARTPNASSALQRATFDAAQVEFDANSSARTVRSRPSFEDVMQRSAKRQTRGNDVLSSQVLQWAQEDETSSSSEDEGPGLAGILAASAQSRPIAHSPVTRGVPTSASKLLPSPVNFDRLGGIHEVNKSPSLGQDGGPRRGIMDRFMSDRPNSASEESAPHQLGKEQIAPPGSPPRRANYAQQLLASPAPSKPSPSVLFSPDVAKLLRSELDQLEANEVAAGGSRRPSSPLKNVDRSSDIVSVIPLPGFLRFRPMMTERLAFAYRSSIRAPSKEEAHSRRQERPELAMSSEAMLSLLRSEPVGPTSYQLPTTAWSLRHPRRPLPLSEPLRSATRRLRPRNMARSPRALNTRVNRSPRLTRRRPPISPTVTPLLLPPRPRRTTRSTCPPATRARVRDLRSAAGATSRAATASRASRALLPYQPLFALQRELLLPCLLATRLSTRRKVSKIRTRSQLGPTRRSSVKPSSRQRTTRCRSPTSTRSSCATTRTTRSRMPAGKTRSGTTSRLMSVSSRRLVGRTTPGRVRSGPSSPDAKISSPMEGSSRGEVR